MKDKISTFFREKDHERTLKEQIEILNKLLVSKEESIKAKDAQYRGMESVWLTKEEKLVASAQAKDRANATMEKRMKEMEEIMHKTEKNLMETERRLEAEKKRCNLFENCFLGKEKQLNEVQELYQREKAKNASLEDDVEQAYQRIQDLESDRNHLERCWNDARVELERAKIAEMAKDFLESSHMIEPDDDCIEFEELVDTSPSTPSTQQSEDTTETNEYRKELDEERRAKDEVVALLVKISKLLKLDAESAKEIEEMGKGMEQADATLDTFLDKTSIFREMLSVKTKVITQYRQRFRSIQQQLAEADSTERIMSGNLRKMEEELKATTQIPSVKKQQKLLVDLGTKEKQIGSLHGQLERLSKEMEEKEKSLNSLFATIQTAELELEEKENEYFALNEKVLDYRKRLRDREKELDQLQRQTSQLEESIDESNTMVVMYSSICKAKEEALKSKEDLLMHFEELMQQSDDQMREKDEQVAILYSNLKDASIIDNYKK